MWRKDEESVAVTKRSLPTRGLETSTKIWIREKAKRDQQLWGNQDSLWVVENKLYDLTDFIKKHPGGPEWLIHTKGQDITEYFITHHLNEEKARKIMDKYYVGECQKKQKPRYTFEEAGLFRRVKNRLLKQHTAEQLQNWDKSVKNGTVITLLWLMFFVSSGLFGSFVLAAVAGLLGYPMLGVAHNFIHMRHHPFRYLWMVTGWTHQEWQKMHCLSHHAYPNTLLDFQIQGLEPIAYFLKCTPANSPLTYVAKELVYLIAAPVNTLLKVVIIPLTKQEKPELLYLVWTLQIPAMYWLTNDWWLTIQLICVIHGVMNLAFFHLAGAGHRTGREWTEGDKQIRDFGEHQVASSTNMASRRSGFWSYVINAGFNIHSVHHMFPTIDNHSLPIADAIIDEQCRKMGVKKHETQSVGQALYEIEVNFFNRNRNKDHTK